MPPPCKFFLRMDVRRDTRIGTYVSKQASKQANKHINSLPLLVCDFVGFPLHPRCNIDAVFIAVYKLWHDYLCSPSISLHFSSSSLSNGIDFESLTTRIGEVLAQAREQCAKYSAGT
jgi:hypothetical protein